MRTILKNELFPKGIDQKKADQQSARETVIQAGSSTHAGLWFDKYLFSLDRNDTISKSTLIRQVSNLEVPEIYSQFYNRWKEQLNDSGAQTYVFRVDGRMIVGLGSESITETAIALHHTYGVPYIPGSSLKGVTASYARNKLEKWGKETEGYLTIFGEQESAGYVTFFDALYIPGSAPTTPGNSGPLKPDIITVHHPEYYQGKNAPPADWDSPTPISLLSATGSYLVALAAPDIKGAERKRWLDATYQLVRMALEHYGVGAKTSSGYGRLKPA